MYVSILGQYVSQLPLSIVLTIVLFFLCLLAGYVGSVIAGFRAERGEGLRGLLIFPITNPFALIAFCCRDWKAACGPLVCYLMALAILPIGGAVAQRVEKNRLVSYQQELTGRGENFEVTQYIPTPVPEDQNVWGHPFLKPVAAANRLSASGEVDSDLSGYDAMRIPYNTAEDVQYVQDEDRETRRRGRPWIEPFGRLHRTALATTAGEELLAQGKAPESWEDCGRLVLAHFEPADTDFAALTEAVFRPVDQYPYAWEEGFSMVMPSLAKSKQFSQAACYRSMARAAVGQSEESFADLQLALRLVQTGDCDLLISRLVQLAQTAITVDPILFAQQCHLWNEAEWASIQDFLMTLDLPGQAPASLRCERVLGNLTILPMIELSAVKIRETLDELGSIQPEPPPPISVWESGIHGVTDFFVGGLARAFLTSQWRLCLEGYQEFIEATETAVSRSRTEPWRDLEAADIHVAGGEYGILAKMLLPALQKAFTRAIDVQVMVDLAVVGCALERHLLAHSEYPDSLDKLAPEFLPKAPLDPMTGDRWHYERTGPRGFHLYSLGRNGIDDGGLRSLPGTPQNAGESLKDDVAWTVTEQLPPLPGFVYTPPGTGAQSTDYQKMLMKRYGIMTTE